MDQPKVNKSLSSEAVQAIAKALTMAEVGRGRTLLTRSEKPHLLSTGVCGASS